MRVPLLDEVAVRRAEGVEVHRLLSLAVRDSLPVGVAIAQTGDPSEAPITSIHALVPRRHQLRERELSLALNNHLDERLVELLRAALGDDRRRR